MLVTCEKCSSRYQIADDKIKPTGTKVRCPRCQHTFRIFLEEPKPQEAFSAPAQPAAPANARPSFSPTPPAPPPRQAPNPNFAPSMMPTEPGTSMPQPRSSSTHVQNTSDIQGLADSTEFFQRKQDSIRKPSAANEKISPSFSPTPVKETVTSDMFAPQTRAKPMKDPSPFKKSMKSDFEDDVFKAPGLSDESEQHSMDASIAGGESDVSATASKRAMFDPEPMEGPTPSPKPFGDATFFALQQMTKPKSSSRRLVIAALVIVVVAMAFFVLTQGPSRQAPEVTKVASKDATQTKLAFERPAQWYKDDPNVFQDFLTQTAARPSVDQRKPETRALVAEALILNGMLNGADDQIASGLGMASSLIAAYPNSIYGYYALSTYAEWRDDTQTLSDLVQKWPANNRSEPEFRLAQILVEAHSKESARALEAAKAFLMDMPDNKRAQIFVLSPLLDASEEIQKSYGERLMQEMQKTYQKLRSTYSSNTSLPPILKSIDKKFARRTLVAANTPAPAPNKSPEINLGADNATQKLNERSLQRLEERRKQLMTESGVEAQNTGASEKAHSAAAPHKPAQDPKKLPKASTELVAKNREVKREKTEAERIFEQASNLQKQNHLEEAISLYQKTLRLNPDFADVYRNLGMIYMNRQEKERALRNFKIYLQLKPQSEDKQMVEGWISSLQ